MKNPNEIVVLRTKLRDVNVEYSALVRARRSDDGRPARLQALQMQRQALMARIFDASQVGEPGAIETFVRDGSLQRNTRKDRVRAGAAAPG